MVSVVAVVQVRMSVVAEVAVVAVVSQGIRVVETVAVVGVAVVVEGIGLRSSGSGGLGIGGPLAVVVAVETVRHGGESVQRASVHGGHTGDGGNKRVAVVSISISSRLGVSRPLAVVVSVGIGVTVVAVAVTMAIGKPMSEVVAQVVAVAVVGIVGVSISISLSCHSSKEAKSNNGLKRNSE